MNILFAGNGYVLDGILTASLSLVMRMKERRPVRIHILTMTLTRIKESYTALTEEEAKSIETALTKINPDTRVTLHDVTELYEEHLGYSKNEGCYCSPYTLLRLLADLSALPDKILYLDCDVMFNKDPALLYDTDVSGYEFGAARDHYGRFLIHPNYINAGVLLFNLAECRKTELFKKARALIREKKLVFADQSALIRAKTRRKLLPRRFNDQKFLYRSTVIRHFSKRLFYLPYPHTENIKQWQVEKVKKKFGYTEFDDIYEAYGEYRKTAK